MTIEQFLAECHQAGYDVMLSRTPIFWALAVFRETPSAERPHPHRRYATGNTWEQVLQNWRETDWIIRPVALAVIFGATQEVGV